MATSFYPPAPSQPYVPPGTPVPTGYFTSTDPRKIAKDQNRAVATQGQALMANDQQLANQYFTDASGIQQYLDPVESQLASGQGGYSPEEIQQIELSQGDKSQIELSPQDKQNIVTGAGITAGAGTASEVGAAERAAAAAGGNPSALATYRARAAQTGTANSADAITQARVAAKQQEAAGASTAQQLQAAGGSNVGQARLGQQGQGLSYYGGLDSQKTQAGLAEQGLGHQAYGTETAGTGQAADIGLKASQTPTTTDKIIGGIAGAASAFVADGLPPSSPYQYVADGDADNDEDHGINAVLGEDGPEMIVQGASDPVRDDTKFMAGGDIGDGLPMASGNYGATAAADQMDPVKLSWMQRIVGVANQGQKPGGGKPSQQPAWNKTTPYSDLGKAIGSAAKQYFGPRAPEPGSLQLPNGATYDVPYQPPSPDDPGDSYMADGDAGDGQWMQQTVGVANQNQSQPDSQQDQWNPMSSYQKMQSAIRQGAKVLMDKASGTGASEGVYGADGDIGDGLPMASGDYGATAMADEMGPVKTPSSWMQRIVGIANQGKSPTSGSGQQSSWNPTTPYQQLGTVVGQGAKMAFAGGGGGAMADGGFPADGPDLPKPPQLITSPTRVSLGKSDMVVPLSYRPKAKIRPSMAVPAIAGMRHRMYGVPRV